MNTKSIESKNLRKALKHAARTRLKATNAALTNEQRSKLRRARAEKHIGLRAFLAKEAKTAS
jgi:hypothetical protein